MGRRVAVIAAAFLFFACERKGGNSSQDVQTLEARPSLLAVMQGSVAFRSELLGEVPIISEAEWLRLLEKGTGSPSEVARREGARLDAMANARQSLGLFGVAESGPLDTELVVVARDLWADSEGYLETQDFYLVVANVQGEASFVSGAILALSKEQLLGPRCDAVRGCRAVRNSEQDFLTWANPDEGALGLPGDVTLNLESPPAPANAAGTTVPMRIYGAPESSVVSWNEFSCHEQIFAASCSAALAPRDLSSLATLRVPVPGNGVVPVIRESDLNQAIAERRVDAADPSTLPVLLATQSNASHLIGIQATLTQSLSFDTTTFIVLRDWGLDSSGRIEGSEWYIFSGKVDFEFPIAGFSAEYLLEMLPPGFNTVEGPCGLGLIATGSTECGAIQCLPKEVPTLGNMRFGGERWAVGASRGSLRFPLPGFPSRSTAYLCSQFLPPDNPTTEWCRNASEVCNGADDNCNGVFDEGGVCEVTCR